ncbi:DEAD/DEAH box helicase [Synechococcales cyanobacterium C]|uniref:DEAD/DEAH box helicase n=1 Tax=Petrachloros mirabilis ULC683 TaxID=2781853 RepID=A0A8K2A0D6_9CYAN|nr:DEAD/DEAH box helicase [Petrachloros mirabilis ULC683]
MSSSLPELSRIFPFPLDDFQQAAIAALNAGQSVVVSAPTGSGKTLIGEYAIHRALAQGRRIFYTTPLKALSNQKLRDFRAQFGHDQVGLLTGDLSVNREAPILVMTTEIFRNILYGTLLDDLSPSLTGVEAVVLDECHYMNDRQRGTVWEESIIYCPAEIQLIALSATIANAAQLADWMSWVHGSTQLIFSDVRPVPLRFEFGNAKGLFPLLNDAQTQIHPQMRRHLPKRTNGRRPYRSDLPDLVTLLAQLQGRQMLPAIYFIFSRRGCDQALQSLSDLTLLSAQEAQEIQARIDAFLADHPDIGRSTHVEALYQGVAAHHAGLLPLWKGFVEELFQQGLIKVVFATETLAAGINMPARTTIISSLSKRTDLGHRLLTPSEFLQMSGRAGRRGMDSLGYVITLQTPFEGAKEAAYLATAGAEPLESQFTPSYGMVLNLLQTHTLEEAQALIERSFGQYLAIQQLAPQKQAIVTLEQEQAQLQAKLSGIDLKALKSYQKLRERLKEEQRLLKTLQTQANEYQGSILAPEAAKAQPGTRLGIKLRGVPGSTLTQPQVAVLMAQLPGSGQLPYLVCLNAENQWHIVACHDVLALDTPISLVVDGTPLPLPANLPRKLGQSHPGDDQSAILAQRLSAVNWEPDPEVWAQFQRLNAVQEQLDQHAAHDSRQRHPQYLRWLRRTQVLESQLRDRRSKLDRQMHLHWQAFLSLVEILQTFEALQSLAPTVLGQVAAAVRGENELWLALALTSGALDALDPQHLASACAALVVEGSRSDSWTRYPLSSPVKATLTQLQPLRRKLIQWQHRHNVVFPVWLDLELVGLVEQWALETSWADLCAHTSLDEGDIVRILRRTLDVLSQIPHLPHLSPDLQKNAQRAKQLLDRFPINELSEDVTA